MRGCFLIKASELGGMSDETHAGSSRGSKQ